MAVSFNTALRPSATMRPMPLQMHLGWVIVYVDEPAAAADGEPPNVELALIHEDVEAAYAAALEAGCASLAEPEDKPQGQRVAYVRDPFGTLVELATPL